MSTRLKDLVTQRLEQLRMAGKNSPESHLAVKAGVSPSTIRNILNGRIVTSVVAYKVVIGCDGGAALAQEIANECTEFKANQSA